MRTQIATDSSGQAHHGVRAELRTDQPLHLLDGRSAQPVVTLAGEADALDGVPRIDVEVGLGLGWRFVGGIGGLGAEACGRQQSQKSELHGYSWMQSLFQS